MNLDQATSFITCASRGRGQAAARAAPACGSRQLRAGPSAHPAEDLQAMGGWSQK